MTLMRTFTPSHPSGIARWLSNDDLRDALLSNFSPTETTVPAVNVKETDTEFELEVAAPGMKKDDFQINLENDILTISSEREEEKEEENGRFARQEFSYQSFQRTFSLPENMVDSEKIDAKYHDGILHLTLPKLEHAKTKPPRQIKIH